jgi:hypothetical protein
MRSVLAEVFSNRCLAIVLPLFFLASGSGQFFQQTFRVRIKTGTAAKVFNERLVKRTKARITDRHRRFRDAHFSRAEQLGSLFDTFNPQMPGNAGAGMLGKNAAEIKRTALHFLGQHVEGGRILNVPFQKKEDTFATFPVQALMPLAEKFRRGFWLKEQMRQYLRCLALVPNVIGRLMNRRVEEIEPVIQQMGRHLADMNDGACSLRIFEKTSDFRFEPIQNCI